MQPRLKWKVSNDRCVLERFNCLMPIARAIQLLAITNLTRVETNAVCSILNYSLELLFGSRKSFISCLGQSGFNAGSGRSRFHAHLSTNS
jgi:hypothetical protein